MKNNPKICMVTSRFYPVYGGGARQAFSLCQKLKQRGVDPMVVTRSYDGKTKHEVINGIDIFRIAPSTDVKRLGGLSFYSKLFWFLVKQCKNYDIIHCHYISYHTYAALLAARLLGKKSIAKMGSLGGDDPISIKKRRFGKLQFKITSLADRIIATSNELMQSVKSVGLGQKGLQIPNGVNCKKFAPVSAEKKKNLRAKLGIGEHQFVVIFVGGPNQKVCLRKGLDILIKSWAKIKKDIPKAQLIIVGPKINNFSPSLREKLKTKKDVACLGQVQNVEEYLKASDLFVLPTRKEGMPNSLLEAIACGLPVVVSDLGCNLEIIEHRKNGLISKMNNSEALADSIVELSQDKALREKLSQNARNIAIKRFSLKSISDKYISLYKELLEK